MTDYKQKTKQIIVNSAKQPLCTFRGDIAFFNLNACFVKKNGFAKFESSIKEILETTHLINFGNLASMCYKLEMDYGSKDTLSFVETIIEIAKYTGAVIIQSNISLYGETDMQPIESLIKYDKQLGIIYTNQVLIDCLKLLGYVDSQVRDVIDVTKDFRKVIPSDLVSELPIRNRRNNKAYERMLALI